MASQHQILVFGGSGRVGQQVITNALSKGYKVTALVRNPASIPPQTNLTIVSGQPTSTQDIINTLTNISTSNSNSNSSPIPTKITIISTLGQTRSNPSNPWSQVTSPPLYMSQSTQAVVDALHAPTIASNKSISVEKYIVLSAFGVGDSWPYLHWSLRWVMTHSNMRPMLDDHNAIVEIVRKNFPMGTSIGNAESAELGSRLPTRVVLVRPTMLKFGQTGEVPGVREYGSGEEGMGVFLGCDTRSVTGFMLDCVESEEFDGMMPVISN